MKNYKIHTATIHDPILAAVNEAQPFEQAGSAGDRVSYTQLAQQQQMNDVFGRPIHKPDISNPTRSRDERPLDTIRGFEYAITGDAHYKDRLETEVLGFRVRDTFPKFTSNPYGHSNVNNNGNSNNNAPVHNFSGGDQPEQGVYTAPAGKKITTDKKKKKKSFFGRKHN